MFNICNRTNLSKSYLGFYTQYATYIFASFSDTGVHFDPKTLPLLGYFQPKGSGGKGGEIDHNGKDLGEKSIPVQRILPKTRIFQVKTGKFQ